MFKNKIISFDFVNKVFKGKYKRPWSSVRCFKDIRDEVIDSLNKHNYDWNEWAISPDLYYCMSVEQEKGVYLIKVVKKNGEIKDFSARKLLEDYFDFNN